MLWGLGFGLYPCVAFLLGISASWWWLLPAAIFGILGLGGISQESSDQKMRCTVELDEVDGRTLWVSAPSEEGDAPVRAAFSRVRLLREVKEGETLEDADTVALEVMGRDEQGQERMIWAYPGLDPERAQVMRETLRALILQVAPYAFQDELGQAEAVIFGHDEVGDDAQVEQAHSQAVAQGAGSSW